MRVRTLAAVGLLGGMLASAYAGPIGLVVSAKRAYAVLPPTSLTDGVIQHTEWSPDGDRILVASRSDASTAQQLLSFDPAQRVAGPLLIQSWDRASHRVRALWSSDDPTARVDSIHWLTRSTSALITLEWKTESGSTGYGVLMVNAGTGEFKWPNGLESLKGRPEVVSSPTQPWAAIEYNDTGDQPTQQGSAIERDVSGLLQQIFAISDTGNQRTYKFIARSIVFDSQTNANRFMTVDSAGLIRRSARLDKPSTLPIVWNSDGTDWFLRQSEPTGNRSTLMRLTDSGSLLPTTEEAYRPPADVEPLDLQVQQKLASAELGKTKTSLSGVWLFGDQTVSHGALLLAPDGSWPLLSPSGRAVFYTDHGVAKVREIAPVTPQQVAALEKAAAVDSDGAPIELIYHLQTAAETAEIGNRLQIVIGQAAGQAKPVPR